MNAFSRALGLLSDSDLLSEVKRLAANERQVTSELVASIAVLDARRLYLAEGYPSTHAYCVGALGFSHDAAFYRITAARVVQKFPETLDLLATGALTLKAIRLLAPHLDEGNHVELLEAAAHKSADEIEHLLAARRPRPDVPSSIRKLPERSDGQTISAEPGLPDRRGGEALVTEPRTAPGPSAALTSSRADGTGTMTVANQPETSTHLPQGGHDTLRSSGLETAAESQATAAALEAADARQRLLTPRGAEAGFLTPSSPERRPVLEPLAPGRYKLQVTISGETREKLQRARDLLRHQVQDGDIAIVLDRALTLLVEDLERKKAAILRRPRAKADPLPRPKQETTGPRDSSRQALAGPPKDEETGEKTGRPPAGERDGSGQREGRGRPSRYIPAAVRREVWQRDQGRCAYVGSQGRCAKTSGLEFHHVVPFAAGGPATVANVRLTCTLHNRHEAERFFGSDYTEHRRTATRTRNAGPACSGATKKLPPVVAPSHRSP